MSSIKRLLPLLIFFALRLSAAGQQQAPAGNIVLTDEMVKQLITFDVQRFHLTSEQTDQDKKVITDYQVNSNALAQQKDLSQEQLRQSIRKIRLELAAVYKSFLNADQYNHFLATYNKMHPNDQLH